jgi:hypothetical protein
VRPAIRWCRRRRGDGIGDRDANFVSEDLLDVPAVLLRAVRDEDGVVIDCDAAARVVVFADRIEQELVALVGRIAAETLGCSHLADRAAHRVHHRGHQRQRHVADP